MLLRRLGNKAKSAPKIIKHFPHHTRYIELFFGAGGMFFNKPRVQYNFLNDLDSEVYNLFAVLKSDYEGLLEWCELMPIHNTLFQHWRHKKETDPIMRAVRFLLLSNVGFNGKPDTMALIDCNDKKILLKNTKATLKEIQDCKFLNCDFRKVEKNIRITEKYNYKKTFIYADPPYLETSNNYQTPEWTLQDSGDLFAMCASSKYKFAISEFDHPDIIALADKYKLNKNKIAERKNLGNRRIEMLYTNYTNTNTLF